MVFGRAAAEFPFALIESLIMLATRSSSASASSLYLDCLVLRSSFGGDRVNGSDDEQATSRVRSLPGLLTDFRLLRDANTASPTLGFSCATEVFCN